MPNEVGQTCELLVEVLLENHAEIHTGSRMGNALMAASFRGYTEIVEKLLKAGARLNDTNEAAGVWDAATRTEQQGNQELADLLRSTTKNKEV